jgi:chromosome segregation ATPase
MAEKVVIEFVPDFNQVISAIEALQQKGILKKEDADLLDKASKNMKDFTASTDKATESVDEFGNAVVKDTKSVEALANEVKDVPLVVFKKGLDDAGNSLGQFAKKGGEVVAESKSLKGQLRELKAEMAALEDQGKDNTAEFEKMQIKAGQLSDQIGDTSMRVRVLGDDSKHIKAVSQAITGAAAAFSVGQGAAALFGGENKEVEKALLKVNAAMAIANGLAQINEVIQKQSYLSIMANTAATKLYALVVGESTGALKAMRLAMAATGIGLLIFAVIELVQNFDKIKEALNIGVNPATEKYIIATDKAAAASQKAIESFALQERQMRALGVAEEEIAKKRLGVVKTQLKTTEDQIDAQKKKLVESISNVKEFKENVTATADLVTKTLSLPNLGNKYASSILNFIGIGTSDKDVSEIKKNIDDLVAKKEELKTQVIEINAEIAKDDKDKAKKTSEVIKTASLEDINNRILAQDTILKKQKEGSVEQLAELVKLENLKAEKLTAEVKLSTDKAETKATKIINIEATLRNTILQLQDAFEEKDEANRLKSIAAAEDAANKKAEAEKKRIKQQEDDLKELHDFVDKAEADREAKEKKAAEKKAELKKLEIQSAISAAKEISDAVFEIESNNRKTLLDEKLSDLEKRKETELANTMLTATQKAAIEAKYAKLEAKEKTKAWEADKQAKLTQAIINGALSIANIWATTVPPASYVLSALSLVAVGAQIAVINAQKVPKFAKGKNVGDMYEGPAIIGEAGRELRFDSDGSVKLYNSATMDHVYKDTIIAPNAITEALLNGTMPMANGAVNKYVSSQTSNVGFDYDKLATSITDNMRNHPKVAINIDEKGFEKRIIQGSNERTILNDRYKMTN